MGCGSSSAGGEADPQLVAQNAKVEAQLKQEAKKKSNEVTFLLLGLTAHVRFLNAFFLLLGTGESGKSTIFKVLLLSFKSHSL